jgi:hypothetical protein
MARSRVGVSLAGVLEAAVMLNSVQALLVMQRGVSKLKGEIVSLGV